MSSTEGGDGEREVWGGFDPNAPMPEYYATPQGRKSMAARLSDIADDLVHPLDKQMVLGAARRVVADADLLPAAQLAVERFGRGMVPEEITPEECIPVFDALAADWRTIASIVRASATPTPASLRALAEWFDNPNKSPAMSVWPSGPNGERYTPGYLLRLIADAMEGR